MGRQNCSFMEYLVVAHCSAYEVKQKETHRRTVGVIDMR